MIVHPSYRIIRLKFLVFGILWSENHRPATGQLLPLMSGTPSLRRAAIRPTIGWLYSLKTGAPEWFGNLMSILTARVSASVEVICRRSGATLRPTIR